jgi:hypothetical protein
MWPHGATALVILLWRVLNFAAFDGSRERFAYSVDLWFMQIFVAVGRALLESRFDLRFLAGMDDPYNIRIARKVEQEGKLDSAQLCCHSGSFVTRCRSFESRTNGTAARAHGARSSPPN